MPIETKLNQISQKLHDRLITTIRDLVRIPSENTPPHGSESGCQQYLAERCQQLGLQTDLYELSSVPELTAHPVFRHQRDYRNRPNLAAKLPGKGGGKSLLLSGHIDTVPRGSEPWRYDPFGAVVDGRRLYGLGANDMKGGIAASLIAIEAILEAGVNLRGEVIFETVVDEEFGGVNGTLAARLRGYNADAAIITEPSQNIICPAQMGGHIVHITLRSQAGGILEQDKKDFHVTDQLHYVLGEIKNFARLRQQQVKSHPLYLHNHDPVPVWILKVNCGGWGTNEPTTVPTICRIELYWQHLPDEQLADISAEFFSWFEAMIAARPELFLIKPEVKFVMEWLPGSAIAKDMSLVQQLAATFSDVTGQAPVIQGFDAPCDMFVFHQHFQTPALLFGPIGGNTHQPDEWVDLPSAQNVMGTLARFIFRWCA